jgi:diazepam-binding inhibitor (GABA receptor modulating acyl-CoA-binding protein)
MATKKENPMKERFAAAKARVETLSTRPSNEELLDLYGLYKQASEGDVTGSRPGMLDVKGRAKFDAWAKRRGTSKDEAMRKYVSLVDRLVAKPG